MTLKRICVFCGARDGNDPVYASAARATGAEMARLRIGLVYGGASCGLMGALADAALNAGGEVDGVIPRMLVDREIAHGGLTRLHLVGTMHERKALMADLSDAFVILPGGAGTMEEFFETWTWAALGIHKKPFGILDVAGYYEPLIRFLDEMTASGFLPRRDRDILHVHSDIGSLLRQLGRSTR